MRRINICIIIFFALVPVYLTVLHSPDIAADEGAFPFFSYRVSMKDKKLDLFAISCNVYGSMRGETAFKPACYKGGRVVECLNPVARDNRGGLLEVEQSEDGITVFNRGRDFSLEYQVVLSVVDRYKPDLEGMISFPGRDRLRILGGDLFLLPQLDSPGRIIVDLDSCFPGKKIAARPVINGRVVVPGMDGLATMMAGCGEYRWKKREVKGVKLSLAMGGSWNFGDDEFFDLICEIVSREISMFGSSPYSHYIFICDPNPVRDADRFDMYGMHIGNGMLLLLDRGLDRSSLFDTPISIVAHEFFHNWNGEVLKPVDNRFLWFTEGVTVYFSYQVLMDINILTSRQYNLNRESIMKQYVDNPRRQEIPIAEAINSRLDNKNMVNLLYHGGFLAAEALEKRIRNSSGGRAGLIDVLKIMYSECSSICRIDETTLTDAVLRVGGGDISGFLEELVHTPDSHLIPYDSDTAREEITLY